MDCDKLLKNFGFIADVRCIPDSFCGSKKNSFSRRASRIGPVPTGVTTCYKPLTLW